MDKRKAEQLIKTILDAERAADAAVMAMGDRVSRDASDLCLNYLTDAQVHVGLNLLSQLWDEFPDLAPTPSDNFLLRRFTVPAAEMAPVRKALADLISAIDVAKVLVDEGASTPGERMGYLTVLAQTRTKLQEADARFADLET